jgi:hypothetical protein
MLLMIVDVIAVLTSLHWYEGALVLLRLSAEAGARASSLEKIEYLMSTMENTYRARCDVKEANTHVHNVYVVRLARIISSVGIEEIDRGRSSTGL